MTGSRLAIGENGDHWRREMGEERERGGGGEREEEREREREGGEGERRGGNSDGTELGVDIAYTMDGRAMLMSLKLASSSCGICSVLSDIRPMLDPPSTVS